MVIPLVLVGAGGAGAATTTSVAFANYAAPPGFTAPRPSNQCIGSLHPLTCDWTGEPSIGVDLKTGKVMYQSWLTTARISFDDSKSPPTASWQDVSWPGTSVDTFDSILFTDPATGRTVVSQLTGVCSVSAFTDDDGTNWTPAVKPCQTPAGADHQTIGGGPFPSAGLPHVGYPDALYYCSQNFAYASCAVSLDGGLNYGVGGPMYAVDMCEGLHGHVKVAPDGTVYVPNKGCGAPDCAVVTAGASSPCRKGLLISKNEGLTWQLSLIPDSTVKDAGGSDPSVGIGRLGTVYYGYDGRDGQPRIAVSHDHGTTWSPSVDVGAAVGVHNIEFPEVVAGDDNRAAFAFIGTSTAGDDQDPAFAGVWYLYVAFTYNGGRTWKTVNATPGDPVQRGCVQLLTDCGRRNMLDFNDMTIDQYGRVLVAYTDGCAGPCETDPTNTQQYRVASLVRQTCGRGLMAVDDSETRLDC